MCMHHVGKGRETLIKSGTTTQERDVIILPNRVLEDLCFAAYACVCMTQ